MIHGTESDFVAFMASTLAVILLLILTFKSTLDKFANLGLFLATTSLALATVYLAWGARDSETHQLRAFVYADHADWHHVQKEEAESLMMLGIGGYGKRTKDIVEINVFIQNGGNTEATNLRVQIACTPARGVDEPFRLFRWDDNVAKPDFLGPQQTKEIGPCAELSAQQVGANAMGLGPGPMYILGEMRYGDVFNRGPHVTQFAWELRFFNEDLANLNGRAVSVGRYNCTDDACPAH